MNKRIIKFRAWHKKLKQMFSAEEMAEDQLTMLPTGQFINVSSVSTKLSKISEDMIPFQFTGLKDKNGVEIYEGDVVLYRTTVHFEGGGIEDEAVAEVRWNRWNWALFIQDEFFKYLYAHTTNNSEVIGNIFEESEKQNEPTALGFFTTDEVSK